MVCIYFDLNPNKIWSQIWNWKIKISNSFLFVLFLWCLFFQNRKVFILLYYSHSFFKYIAQNVLNDIIQSGKWKMRNRGKILLCVFPCQTLYMYVKINVVNILLNSSFLTYINYFYFYKPNQRKAFHL